MSVNRKYQENNDEIFNLRNKHEDLREDIFH